MILLILKIFLLVEISKKFLAEKKQFLLRLLEKMINVNPMDIIMGNNNKEIKMCSMEDTLLILNLIHCNLWIRHLREKLDLIEEIQNIMELIIDINNSIFQFNFIKSLKEVFINIIYWSKVQLDHICNNIKCFFRFKFFHNSC